MVQERLLPISWIRPVRPARRVVQALRRATMRHRRRKRLREEHHPQARRASVRRRGGPDPPRRARHPHTQAIRPPPSHLRPLPGLHALPSLRQSPLFTLFNFPPEVFFRYATTSRSATPRTFGTTTACGGQQSSAAQLSSWDASRRPSTRTSSAPCATTSPAFRRARRRCLGGTSTTRACAARAGCLRAVGRR